MQADRRDFRDRKNNDLGACFSVNPRRRSAGLFDREKLVRLFKGNEARHPHICRSLVMFRSLAFCILSLAAAAPLRAEEITEQSLMQAATELAKQYDTYYGAKNVDGMTKVYAADAILISPSGAVVRGTEGLKPYYEKRFASGAKDHATTITEVHLQGNGGYGIGHFAVTVPEKDGKERREEGNLATVYQHEADGWHIKLLVPSALPVK
jgi:ketosteroid isomerase-like protein